MMIINICVLLVWTLFLVYVRIPSVIHKNPHKCQHQFSCGKFTGNFVNYPYKVKGDPPNCGGDYLLACENNRTVLYSSSNSDQYYYVVEEENYGGSGSRPSKTSSSIRVLDPSLRQNNCSTFPRYSFPGGHYRDYMKDDDDDEYLIIFVGCGRAVNSTKYVAISPCLTGNNEFSDQTAAAGGSERVVHSYAVFGKAWEMLTSEIEETCTVYRSVRSRFPSLDSGSKKQIISFQDIHDAMTAGYELQWPNDGQGSLFLDVFIGKYRFEAMLSALIVVARTIVGSILVFAFLIYKCRRRHLSIYDAIEDFLQDRNNTIPIRYSYKEVKKMTNNFREKLGEGGFGSVYKGKLRSNQLVGVKMLSTKSKANGKDFINEVATLGRIHHVNVVRLVGFCVTASKNVLIYEYMPNGSLDKFIFAKPSQDTQLNWNNMYEIAVGVARGIEYLHHGCHMQILHFDIKPHNILLDENFVPKISDFGLAKLRPVKNNAVTMTAARGTLGYMAPELFYKRVGEISYKADVYSFGMLLMEMAGRRRNLNENVDHSSQEYFPSWIYDQFQQGQDVDFGIHFSEGGEEKEKGVAKRLILIALSCIQMAPNDRPSMKQVLDMLRQESKDLELPPKPHFYPPHPPLVVEENSSFESSEECDYTESLCESISLEIEQLNHS